jgi:hypothetical protein
VLLPPPLEGNFATLTIRSYDEAFRAQNSVKGEWVDGQWPGGAMKADLTVVEGVPPEQSLAEFASDLLQQSEFATLVSVEELQVGTQQAVAVVTGRSNDATERHTTYAFRLAPDKVLLMSILPEDAWQSGDMQGILGSIALSGEEPVTMPAYPPGAPIIDVPEGCGG